MEDEIYRRISDITISMKATEYLKMPECVMNEVKVNISEKEMKLCNSLKKDIVLAIANKEIDAVNAAALSNKLSQMANGKPVLVAYWFKHDLERIRKRFYVKEIKSSKDISDWNDGKIPVAVWEIAVEDELALDLSHLLLQKGTCVAD